MRDNPGNKRLARVIDIMLANHDAELDRLGKLYDALDSTVVRYLDLFRAIAEDPKARAAIGGELREKLRPVIDFDEYETE